MNLNTISLAVKGLKPAYDNYSDYRDKKIAELYDATQEAEKVAVAQNEAAKSVASTWVGDAKEKVSGAREQFTEQTDELTNKIEKRSKQTKRGAKLKSRETRCKTRCETKKVGKKAKKTHKDLEVRTQGAIDKVTGKEEQRTKNGCIAATSLVFAVVATIVGVIAWKLRKDDKLLVDPAPYQQKAEVLKTRVEDRAAEVKKTVEGKAPETREKTEEVRDKTAGEADEARDKAVEAKKTTRKEAAEASKQAQIKVDEVKTKKKNADDTEKISSKPSKPAPKLGQARKR